MSKSAAWLFLALVMVALNTVATVRADVRSPIKIRMRPEATPAVNGQMYSGVLEVIPSKDGVLDAIELGGDGWISLAVGLPAPTPALRGQVFEVPFEAHVLDASKRLEVRVTFDGSATIKRIDLRPERLAWIGRDRPSVRVESEKRLDAMGIGDTGGGDGQRGCDDQLIRVRGRIEYVRPDGQVIGADGIHFQIMDEDTVDSEVMFDSYTDEQGGFDVTVCWDDCDISGCDDPDIYLRYECDTGVVNVHNNDAGEDTYSWSTIDTLVFEDYTGDDVNFGNQRPADPGTFPAIHMHNSVTRAHRFVLENNGANIPKVSLVWNDDGWAFYRPNDQEINIGPTHQWSETTHVHEWGHHLLYEWSDPLDVDYCNGFCDDRGVDVCGMETCVDNGGHCLWCNETDHDAWNEGFPDWLGSVVTRMWQARYGGPPPISVNDLPLEATDVCCDGTAHNGLITEGFVGALLRDIEDGVQDPGQSACPQDCLALGPDEILAVVKASRPVRVMEFINAFRAALPNFEFDFRSTALSVSDDYVAGWSLPTLQLLGLNGCGTYRTGETIQLSVDTNASQYSTCMRWQRNGADVVDTGDGRISGATTDMLTITNAVAGDAGSYTLRIRSCDGAPPNECDGSTQSTTSPPISVRVIDANPLGHRITGWGRNTYGMLGRGSTLPDSDVNPADVINLSNAVGVSAGYWNSIAVMSDGTAWTWGSRYLGNGTSDMSATPVQVNFLTDVVAVAAGSPEGNCMALDANGHVWTWGSNYQGLLGYYQASGVALNPGQVNLECVVDISIGNYHAAAITGDGSLWMWGTNGNGELGQGTTGGASNLPVRVADLSNVVDVDCGGSHTLALLADGTLWACGWNNYGQLGDGTTQNRNRFVQVSGLASVAGMAAGNLHSVARLASGQAWAWGYNGEHALGTGAPMWASYPTPAPVINVGNVRAVAAGYALSVFTATDGTIWTCGSNGSGQLGRPFNGTESGYLPAPVDTRVGASVIASAGVSFVMTIAPGARIIAPVADQFVAGCATASLTVDTVGEPPLNYQWGRNVGGLFVPLNETARVTGTTTPTLTISPTQPLDTDLYQVIVTNSTNTVRSNVVTLETPPRVNKFALPQDASRWANERGNWAIVDGSYAAGTPTIYQNSAYSSFTLPQSDFLIELDVVNASHANFDTNGGIYLRSSLSSALPYPRGVVLAFGEAYPWGGGDVYWHRNYGSGYNSAQNIAQNVYTAGQTLHLRIEVRGDTYTAWANDSLTPSTTLVTPDFPAGKIALLDGVVNGTSFDNIFIQSLTSCEPGSGIEPVRIIQRPQSQTVLSGALVTLTVAATGAEPLSYQWLRNGDCIDGATEPSFAFTAAVGTTGRFECTVTNACGSVGSYPAFVSVTGGGPADGSPEEAENPDVFQPVPP
ncbi:MAG: hypothetical protein CHACPFDD_00899 [Phycisphaerae bacterium]|nr:hypothetical protein [Phycisphaerae bacterium]